MGLTGRIKQRWDNLSKTKRFSVKTATLGLGVAFAVGSVSSKIKTSRVIEQRSSELKASGIMHPKAWAGEIIKNGERDFSVKEKNIIGRVVAKLNPKTPELTYMHIEDFVDRIGQNLHLIRNGEKRFGFSINQLGNATAKMSVKEKFEMNRSVLALVQFFRMDEELQQKVIELAKEQSRLGGKNTQKTKRLPLD
ncbi:MAG: hypothetical protein NTY48_05090 [Candidatus Diapherotrites archaeon]|nr:hypothetical protein [Candidatus Diapherotrites archaeon]